MPMLLTQVLAYKGKMILGGIPLIALAYYKIECDKTIYQILIKYIIYYLSCQWNFTKKILVFYGNYCILFKYNMYYEKGMIN